MELETNPQLQLAFDFLHYTNKNIFLTGKAGTGKTTFLKNLKKTSPKRMIVVAPTGVAAINAGGITIHSFFQLNFGPQIPTNILAENSEEISVSTSHKVYDYKRFSKIKIDIIRSLDLLVIDEISMVRADILDWIDEVLRRYKNRFKPFGGVQLLMIGDLQQLAPVVKEDEWEILRKFYDTCYFFSSNALKQSEFIGIELKHIFRQSDQKFIDLLNRVRDNTLDRNDLQKLNNRFNSNFNPNDDEGFITLTTHNFQSQRINDEKLKLLTTQKHKFQCQIVGEFPEYSYPADETLALKTGAQVMFIRNDSSAEKRYYNGKIGKIIGFEGDIIEVHCQGDTNSIEVERETWENIRYNLHNETLEIEQEVIGKFIQFPLRLAWAITIHKSQGLTFEKAIIDARQSFAHGQVYVALSRCKSLEGLVLSSQIHVDSVISDPKVSGFTEKVEKNQPGKEELEKARADFELQLIKEMFDYNSFIRNSQNLIKFWNENSSVLMGSLKEKLVEILKNVNNELMSVTMRFNSQVENLIRQNGFVENNMPLQDRLKKAVTWFSEKTDEIIVIPLESAVFETDNKAIRKRILELLGRIETELEIKKACFASVFIGFSVESFLEARVIANIEKPGSKFKSKSPAIEVQHLEFYRKLIKWREEKSMESGYEEARILPQKTLAEIADILPVSAIGLKAIKKMGGVRMNHFGKEILSLILEYRRQKGMELPKNITDEISIAGMNTKEVTLKMFSEGKSISEIVKVRSLAFSTIESHLLYFVGLGELDVFQIIDEKKYKLIRKCILEKKPGETTADLKNKLGDKISYNEIRLVMATMD